MGRNYRKASILSYFGKPQPYVPGPRFYYGSRGMTNAPTKVMYSLNNRPKPLPRPAYVSKPAFNTSRRQLPQKRGPWPFYNPNARAPLTPQTGAIVPYMPPHTAAKQIYNNMMIKSQLGYDNARRQAYYQAAAQARVNAHNRMVAAERRMQKEAAFAAGAAQRKAEALERLRRNQARRAQQRR